MENEMKIIGWRECTSCGRSGKLPKDVAEATGKDVCDECKGTGQLPIYEKPSDE